MRSRQASATHHHRVTVTYTPAHLASTSSSSCVPISFGTIIAHLFPFVLSWCALHSACIAEAASMSTPTNSRIPVSRIATPHQSTPVTPRQVTPYHGSKLPRPSCSARQGAVDVRSIWKDMDYCNRLDAQDAYHKSTKSVNNVGSRVGHGMIYTDKWARIATRPALLMLAKTPIHHSCRPIRPRTIPPSTTLQLHLRWCRVSLHPHPTPLGLPAISLFTWRRVCRQMRNRPLLRITNMSNQ